MASLTPEPKNEVELATTVESKKAAPPPEVKYPANAPPYFALADVVLRFLLFTTALVGVVVTITGKQTEMIPIPISPFVTSATAKFNYSPAIIYFVAALSVAGIYGIITTLASFCAVLKPGRWSANLLSRFVIFDVILLGVVASATGALAAVGYIALEGNSHIGWRKVCNVYDKFCMHLGSSGAVSLIGSFVLTLLILLSVYSMSKKIQK